MDSEHVFDCQIITRWGLRVCLHREVYDPSDDTYMILEYMDKHKDEIKKARILDVGCGSGVLSLYALKLGAELVVCSDINPYSVMASLCTTRLPENKSVPNGIIEVLRCDLASCFREKNFFDIIVFNPPYLPVECDGSDWVSRAWCGGEDGVSLTRKLLSQARSLLKKEGKVIFIVSSKSDVESLFVFLREIGYDLVVLDEKSFFFEKIYLVKGVLS